jgi:O-antigen ligase
LAAVALAGYVIQQYQSHPVKETIGVQRTLAQELEHYINLGDRSANTRYELWPLGVQAWQTHPVWGVGLYNSRIYVHGADYASGVPLAKLQPLNNDYLGWLSETGLVGVAAMLPLTVLWVLAVILAVRRPGRVTLPFVLAGVGMAVQASTFGSLLLLRTWVVAGLALGVWRLAPLKKPARR